MSDSVRKNLDLQVEKANTQLAGAQKSATDAQNKSNAEIAQAQQALRNAQAKLDTDSGQYRDQCGGRGRHQARCPGTNPRDRHR
ncbi:hypothetical protein ACFQ1S_19895 [Kibdelosporangium lantanae]|uniref:Uncharacterized protein n=1 Tax=Kibdelosporangium lantanae TaxID=1497396 RepID=A0ABW3MBZ3_9PSEU